MDYRCPKCGKAWKIDKELEGLDGCPDCWFTEAAGGAAIAPITLTPKQVARVRFIGVTWVEA